MLDQAASDPIPKIIHLIWIGSEPPAQVRANVESFKRLNSEWEVKLWRDQDLDWLSNKEIYEKAPTYAGRANIARYEIIARFGGHYFDADFEPLLPLVSSEIPTYGLIVCRESASTFNNAFFAAPKGHPFIKQLVEKLPSSFQTYNGSASQIVSGPEYFTRELTQWESMLNNTYSEIPRDLLYPYSWDKLDRASGPWSPLTVAVHHWQQARDRMTKNSGGPMSTAPEKMRFNDISISEVRQRLKIRTRIRDMTASLDAIIDRRLWRPQSASLSDARALTVTKHGWPLVIDTEDLGVLGLLYTQGTYEQAYHAFLSEILEGSDVYVDVGANIGQFVVSAAQYLNSRGRVFAFEPNPRARKTLEMNVYMHRNAGIHKSEVTISKEALGANVGSGTLSVPSVHAGRASLINSNNADIDRMGTQLVQVEVSSLDRELGYLSHIRLVKVDVEGFESDVISGAMQLITSGRIDYLDFESVRAHQGPKIAKLVQMMEVLEDRGAVFSTLTPQGFKPLNRPVRQSLLGNDHGHVLVDLTAIRHA